MAAIDGLPPLRDVIRDHELVAKKQLGQNFLLDLNLTAKIARQAGDLVAGAPVSGPIGGSGFERFDHVQHLSVPLHRQGLFGCPFGLPYRWAAMVALTTPV